jgi:hypothetical protein
MCGSRAVASGRYRVGSSSSSYTRERGTRTLLDIKGTRKIYTKWDLESVEIRRRHTDGTRRAPAQARSRAPRPRRAPARPPAGTHVYTYPEPDVRESR